MDKKPFFSIAIATKNRPNEVELLIQSLLIQSYQDYEIVIADNSDDFLTQEKIKKMHDSKIRYFKTGNLLINDNYRFAVEQCSGSYVLFSRDKHAYYADSLALIYKTLEKTNFTDVLCWKNDSLIHTKNNKIVQTTINSNKIHTIKTKELLDTYTKKIFNGKNNDIQMPIPQLACYSKLFLEKVKTTYGVLFPFWTPDYPTAFAVWNLLNEYSYIDHSMFMTTNSTHSLGGSTSIRDKNFWIEIEKYSHLKKGVFKYMPIKDINVTNTVVSDFYNICSASNSEIQFDCDVVEYFVAVYLEIDNFYAYTVKHNMSQYLDVWYDAFSRLEKEEQAIILQKIKTIRSRYVYKKIRIDIMNFIRDLGGYVLIQFVRKLLGKHGNVHETKLDVSLLEYIKVKRNE